MDYDREDMHRYKDEYPQPTLAQRTKAWIAKLERPFSSISLIGGFVFDAITLQRVDMFWESLWVVGHLAIVTICALILNALENTGEDNEVNPAKLHFWMVNVMQFFFGGIFSTYLVFYFRSGTITTSWPFLIILAIAFIANERLKRHFSRLTFQISLLFLSYYAFAIYLMPIIFHQLGTVIFIVSGIVSLVAIWGVIAILKKFSNEKFTARAKWFTWVSILIITAGINTLYFYNLIPPLPLSLKDAGIYQSLTVNSPGNYTVQKEDQGFFGFFAWNQTIHLQTGGQLYAYTAVFSPTALNTNIVHVWQSYNEVTKIWTTRGRITLSVSGGRDGGYRTYSIMSAITPGLWRVNVETTRGQVIGQLRFNIIGTTAATQPQLEVIKIGPQV